MNYLNSFTGIVVRLMEIPVQQTIKKETSSDKSAERSYLKFVRLQL
jgi:hypothetical protein